MIQPEDGGAGAAVLQELDGLEGPAVVKTSAGDAQVASAYMAASGRRCRPVLLPGAGATALACRDKKSWFYVPPVLAEGLSSLPSTTGQQTSAPLRDARDSGAAPAATQLSSQVAQPADGEAGAHRAATGALVRP